LKTLINTARERDADYYRFSYWNLWGDLKYILKPEKDEPEHGVTGSGYDKAGNERRLFRNHPDATYEMTSYNEHYWEELILPDHFEGVDSERIMGVHLMTVKPSELVARRYFLTRYNRQKRNQHSSFDSFVEEQLSREDMNLREFGKHVLIKKANETGTKFDKEYPSVIRERLNDYPFQFKKRDGEIVDRKEPNHAFEYDI
jgi:hypothetical protein